MSSQGWNVDDLVARPGTPINRQIKIVRRAEGLTQAAFGRALGFRTDAAAQVAVARWEAPRGSQGARSPRLEHLVRIAKLYRVMFTIGPEDT